MVWQRLREDGARMDAVIVLKMHLEITETVNDSKGFDVRLFDGAAAHARKSDT
jgi:hypothetical protein